MKTKHILILVAVVTGFGLLAVLAESISAADKKATTALLASTQNQKPTPPKPTFSDRLRENISHLTTDMAPAQERETPNDIVDAAHSFNSIAVFIKNAPSNLTSGQKDSIDKLKKTLIKKQTSDLPILRKNFTKILHALLWNDNGGATVSGAGNTTLTLTAYTFASNRSIAKFQQGQSDKFSALRFKTIRYKWYKGADEYQYYTMETLPDKALFE